MWLNRRQCRCEGGCFMRAEPKTPEPHVSMTSSQRAPTCPARPSTLLHHQDVNVSRNKQTSSSQLILLLPVASLIWLILFELESKDLCLLPVWGRGGAGRVEGVEERRGVEGAEGWRRGSPLSSCPRSWPTGGSRSSGPPAQGWRGTCRRSGRSPSPPWLHPPGSGASASANVSAGLVSRWACSCLSYWQCWKRRKDQQHQADGS